MDLAGLILQTSNALNLIKKIRDATEALKHSEILCWVSDLMNEMLDIKNNLVEVKNENLELRGKITTLETKLSQDKNWYHDGMRYWKIDNDGNILKKAGAYCATCLDNKDKTIRLLELENGYYSCTPCNKTYGKWQEIDGSLQVRRVR